MIQISKNDIDEARKLISHGDPEAVGYRMMIYLVEATTEMEVHEIEQYEALAKAGFQTKTEEQKDKESKGSNFGILLSAGDSAYKDLGESWVNAGDVVIFERYSGVDIEIPPGSGQMIKFTNDENIFGRMRNEK